ncbi:MAG: hypothetical protein KGH75_00710 [Rhodospirillales bacterium]|nr:hypothetical protein [Rhodospirillales bacterium]
MPITPRALAKLRKSCSFEYLGETVNVEYYPAALSDVAAQGKKITAEVNAAQAADDEAAVRQAMLDTGAWLCGILASWDYLEDDGVTMQPITPENMATQLETFSDFIWAVFTAITTSHTAGNASGTPSSGNSKPISSTMASSASEGASRIPSASSSSPDGSREPPVSNG